MKEDLKLELAAGTHAKTTWNNPVIIPTTSLTPIAIVNGWNTPELEIAHEMVKRFNEQKDIVNSLVEWQTAFPGKTPTDLQIMFSILQKDSIRTDLKLDLSKPEVETKLKAIEAVELSAYLRGITDAANIVMSRAHPDQMANEDLVSCARALRAFHDRQKFTVKQPEK